MKQNIFDCYWVLLVCHWRHGDHRELKQRLFWATHVNRKWTFSSFNMPPVTLNAWTLNCKLLWWFLMSRTGCYWCLATIWSPLMAFTKLNYKSLFLLCLQCSRIINSSFMKTCWQLLAKQFFFSKAISDPMKGPLAYIPLHKKPFKIISPWNTIFF